MVKEDFRKAKKQNWATWGEERLLGLVSEGESDSVTKGNKGWASWNHGSQSAELPGEIQIQGHCSGYPP